MDNNLQTDYLNTAFGIGADLCRNALWNKGTCTWIDVNTDQSKNELIYHPLNYNFYEGNCGIAFFLLNLFQSTGEKVFKKTGLAALNQAWLQSQKEEGKWPSSFYFGKAGLAYVTLKANLLLNDDELNKKSELLLNQICERNFENDPFDITHGTAGSIPFLLWASMINNDSRLVDKAILRAEHLIGCANRVSNTLSWNFQKQHPLPLTGFAHGSSGIGYAFSLLFKFTHTEKYKLSAEMAFNYEDQFFAVEENNWLSTDEINKPGSQKDVYKFSLSKWCYGAAGIGLARAAAYYATGDPRWKNMAEVACKKAMTAKGEMVNFSLCHGHFSNAALLLFASKIFGNNLYLDQAKELGEYGIYFTDKNQREWPGGIGNGVTCKSFMCGNAGIGNFYLQLAGQGLVSSGLLMDELFH